MSRPKVFFISFQDIGLPCISKKLRSKGYVRQFMTGSQRRKFTYVIYIDLLCIYIYWWCNYAQKWKPDSATSTVPQESWWLPLNGSSWYAGASGAIPKRLESTPHSFNFQFAMSTLAHQDSPHRKVAMNLADSNSNSIYPMLIAVDMTFGYIWIYLEGRLRLAIQKIDEMYSAYSVYSFRSFGTSWPQTYLSPGKQLRLCFEKTLRLANPIVPCIMLNVSPCVCSFQIY